MRTRLDRITEISKNKPEERLTSLMHLIDSSLLTASHRKQVGKRARGVDGVDKYAYGKNLSNNVQDLLARMKKLSYRPKPVKRVYIPKAGSNKKRPLGIPSYEDKIVQTALNEVLKSIYEPIFLDTSFGFRNNRNCHDALKYLKKHLDGDKINFVVDVDIKGFFDNLDHEWLMKFLEHKIADKNYLRYIKRFLKSGIIEQGNFAKSYKGAPQGGIISPTLGNIYLHYVLDLWFEKIVKRHCKGQAYMVRYCDDFVCCFQYESDAKRFYKSLINRLSKFNLEVAEEKTKIIEFGMRTYNRSKNNIDIKRPSTFDFLGFTHYCSSSLNGNYRVKRKTSSKKFRSSILKLKEWLRSRMHMRVNMLIKELNVKLVGYFRYYGISDNYKSISCFKDEVQKKLFKILNRRSQRRSYNWEEYCKLLRDIPLAKCKIYVSMFI